MKLEIYKSCKKLGYAEVRRAGTNDKWSLRRIWDKADGTYVVRFNNVDYRFRWDDIVGVDIIEDKYYASKAGQTKAPELKVEIEIEEKEVIPEIAEVEDGEIKHIQYDKIKACIENNIPVYLVGPAGSGKNHTLEQIARELGLEFYFTNSVQQEYKLTGFIDAGGIYHETEFYKVFTNGGLFFLDEMDASIPEVLVLLNAAIANGYFEFPNGKVQANEKFRVVAAGNTVGDGADEQYTGRLVLDQATLDRFAIIEFDYDKRVELFIANGDTDLVEFIRDLRHQSQMKGVRATFSYRAISMVKKLNGKLEVKEILQIAVFKGMDKDTINTFKPLPGNKYGQALSRLQAA